MPEHTCDRKGPPAKVVDETGDEPIDRIYPTCSVCGVPQVFASAEDNLKHDVAVIRDWAISTPVVSRVWLFGSRVKEKHRDDSDLDVAIEHDAVSTEQDAVLVHFDIAAVVRRWREELRPRARLTLDVWSYTPGVDTRLDSALADASRLIFERDAQIQ